MLSVGIVGLPNVGKSTTFNALTKAQNAQAQNYPFCTIEPNKAVVAVPDARLNELAKIVKPEKILHSVIEFVDIAGLVKGASKGEGLGNKFLSNIRQTQLILHIVRCFNDDNITHVQGNIDPLRDIETIETELILADIEQIERKIERLNKDIKSNQKGAKERLNLAQNLLKHLNEGNSARSFEKSEMFDELNKELNLLSAKEVIYGANIDENSISKGNCYVDAVRNFAKISNSEVIEICSKMEEDLIGLSDDEINEFLLGAGSHKSGLERIIQTAFRKLNLISYFTAGPKEVRSWTITNGYKAPKAASVIHNDFEKGFIKAEVISYDDFIKFHGESGAKEAGKLRLEGKDYIVNDGDVMHFRFNV